MDEKLSEEVLLKRLDDASKKITVGAKYRHYKNHDYKVINLAILETNNDICVIYQALYGANLTFIRSVQVWLEEIEWQGKTVKRFTKI